MVTWQEGNVLANGIRLHYYRSGGEKPPIVLAHGITDSGRCWPLVSEALAARYDIIGVDARGHGRSEKPEVGYARETHAADLAGFIEALELRRPAVLGHSMGAGTATVLASTYPSLVGALLLEDPPWRDLGAAIAPPEHAEMWSQQIRERKTLSTDELIEAGRRDNPTWPDAVFGPWAEAKHLVSPNVVGYISDGSATWRSTIEGIQCPVLLLTGDPERGAIVTAEIAAKVQDANSSIQTVHIAGAGHNIRREQFAAYMEAVEAFLAVSYPEA